LTVKPATKSAGTKKPTVITAVTAQVGNQGFSTTLIMHNILIDSEFQALIPPLSAEERAQLEANLLADGCRDPLVVWPCATFDIRLDGGATQTLRYEDGRYQHAIDEHIGPTTAWDLDDNADDDRIDEYGDTITLDQWPHILIDGHNRYEICTRLGLPFEVVVQEFSDREAVMDWMDANQLGRRNLTRDQFTLLIGRRYNRVKKAAHSGANQHTEVTDKMSTTTAETLATDYGVTERTVRRAGQFADAVEVINHAAPGFTATVNAGEAPTRQDVVKAAAVVAQIPEAAQNVALAAEFADLPSEAKQEAIEAIAQLAPAQEVMREAVHNHRAQGTGENEWYTPQEHIDAAYKVLGTIDLDPASSEIANQRVQAGQIFTIADDGLTKEWGGKVWMNPPYAQPHIANFIEKLASEYEAGRVTEAIALTHNYTDTQWFHRAALSCAAICFTRGRIGFLSPEGKRAAPTQGQAFFYYGSKVEQFIEAFCRIGFVVEVRNA
jgi:phage N-6-adenine-methyltransferase